MATENCCVLKQSNCKNAFCNARLPNDKTIIIRPPPGDPNAKKHVFWLPRKTLYGLGCSPHHWHKLVNSILVDLGLTPNLHNPCLYQGVPSSPITRDPTSVAQFPDNQAGSAGKPLRLGLYVEKFVYFSEDPEIERHFKRLLAAKLKVEFMGTVNWFLGTHFE